MVYWMAYMVAYIAYIALVHSSVNMFGGFC